MGKYVPVEVIDSVIEKHGGIGLEEAEDSHVGASKRIGWDR